MCAWASGHKQMCDICGVFNVFKKYLLICLFHKIRQGLIKIFNPGKNYSNKEMRPPALAFWVCVSCSSCLPSFLWSHSIIFSWPLNEEKIQFHYDVVPMGYEFLWFYHI